MANLLRCLFLFAFVCALSWPLRAQQTVQSGDLTGFDEAAVMLEIQQKGVPQSCVYEYLNAKRSEYALRMQEAASGHAHTHPAPQVQNPNPPSSSSMMTPCTNMDFEANSLTGWSGYTGYHPVWNSTGCCPTPGFVAGRFTITSGAGTDTYGGFPVVAPGGNYSLQLGNSNVNGEAELIEQTFTVTPGTTSYTYRYAVVLQDVGHLPNEQPYFRIEMKDASGNTIPCSIYNVAAGQNIPGFLTSTVDPSVVYKPWTTVNVDLSNYVGQNVTIQFEVADCGYGGHFGYAYVDASCVPFALTTSATLCTGDQITLSAPAGAATYAWTPGGQTTQSILVSQPGNYCATMTSVQGCQQQLCTNVQVYPKPTANFGINSPNCSLSAAFTDSSLNTPATWAWDFGDGNNSNVQNPSHTYNSGGLYYVQLIVGTAAGCYDTLVQPLSPGGVPVAGFLDSLICLSGVFTDTTVITQGTLTGWQWDFGDPSSGANNTSVFQNPSHNFTVPGLYNITLIATSSQGCIDTLVQPVTVSTLLNANFNNTSVCEGLTTTFTDVSTSSSGAITTWNWDFGDNTTGNTQNPTHQYTAAGTYPVLLTASTSTGCVGAITQNITVYPLPQAAFQDTNVCLNDPSVFTNLSTIASGTINTYAWNFGNGNNSNQQSPTYTYPAAGTYSVTLVTTSNFGCIDSVTQQIDVYPNPTAAFTVDDVDGCAPHCVTFSDQSTVPSGIVNGWAWDFGDTTGINTTPFPQHCYVAPTTYNVTLTATTNNGCTNTLTLNNYITAYPSPTAEFEASTLTVTTIEPLVQFTDLSLGASEWAWNFGDGDSSVLFIQDHPAHVFPDYGPGVYPVTLTVTSPNGCRDMYQLTVIVEADFSFYAPNAFTPNGDGKNEFFFGTGVGIDEYEMFVFDRWGNKVFYADNQNLMWDGKVNGRLAQEDTYIWKVNLTDLYNKPHSYIGRVTLIR
jgi:gliding motility-associated-like protein